MVTRTHFRCSWHRMIVSTCFTTRIQKADVPYSMKLWYPRAETGLAQKLDAGHLGVCHWPLAADVADDNSSWRNST